MDKASHGLQVEVYVVDNNSVDGSVEMVRDKFPHVKLIANKDNTGFSKANNQAMKIASGEYFLLLNPDTVVEEETFRKVITFMDAHPKAGGLGVKMVDGKGIYLPESKRGLPTPDVAFYKIFGISRIFPKSKKFNKYYLGHLNANETNKIEILSGAFMMMRKAALDKVGLLDEAFFMYGEDIDLSWRIILGGYDNYYLPETTIIHYKGESTKKGSLNYVFVFYNAMIIFARKHFSEKNAKAFSLFINVAIWLRAGAAIVYRFFQRALLPAADIGLILALMFLIKDVYANTQDKIYSNSLVTATFISSALIWSFCAWLGGGYDKPLKPLKVIKALLIGSAVILIGYALLPESLRFSRALILFGSIAALPVWIINRIIFNLLSSGKTGLEKSTNRRLAVVGENDEVDRVKSLLTQSGSSWSFMLPVSVENSESGIDTNHLSDVARVHKLDQIIFCARDISSAQIISLMSQLVSYDLEFKIAPPESLYIIGSNSIETSGDAFMMDINSVSMAGNKRVKRTLDVAMSLVFIIALPFVSWFVKNPIGFVANIFKVILGSKTWVGFDKQGSQKNHLPNLKSGVVNPCLSWIGNELTQEQRDKFNLVYAKDYKVINDLKLIGRAFKFLGQ